MSKYYITTSSMPTLNKNYSCIDSLGNIYILNSTGTIVKMDSSNNILWSNLISSTYGVHPGAITVDSSGNIYITGTISLNSNYYNNGIILLVYNSSGSIISDNLFRGASTDSMDSGDAIVLDGSGNVYIAGSISPNTTTTAMAGIVLKYNISSGLEWATEIKDLSTTPQTVVNGIVLDGSGNVYATGTFNTSAGYPNLFITKLNSSGTLVWLTRFTIGSPPSLGVSGIAVDSSGNLYITGNIGPSGYPEVFVGKINGTNGSFLWQEQFSNIYSYYNNTNGNSIAVDSSGNLYITGNYYQAAKTSYALIAKLNNSGVLQWQSNLTNGTGTTLMGVGYTISLDSSDNIYISGNYDGNSDFFLLTAPSSGPLDGVYATYTGSIAITSSLNNLTLGASNLTTSTAGIGTATLSLITSSLAGIITTTSTPYTWTVDNYFTTTTSNFFLFM